jgi:hemolysin D
MTSSSALATKGEATPPRRSAELQFLPAALEIVETPASPVGRAVGATIIVFFSIALAWAWVGTVDIIAVAPGKIVTNGRTKVIQPLESGVVKEIRVQDGQRVTAGEVLIELDSTVNGADQARLQSDLLAAQLDVARLHAALSDATDPDASFFPPASASPAMIATARQLLSSQTAERQAKLAALDREQAQKLAERDVSGSEIQKIQAVIPLLQEQVNMHKTLANEGYGLKLAYIQTLQALVEQQQELAVQKNRYREAEAAIEAITETRAQAAAEYRHQVLDDLAKAEQKTAELAQELVKAKELTQLQRLVAPVNGTVQQLAVHTIGGVVTPAQPLLALAPLDNHLEIEATVSNQDIGFVRVGQEVEIKVKTFNFTRYGLLHGRVLSVSQDAILGENRTNRRAGESDGTASEASSAGTSEPVFLARISLDRTKMQIDDRLVDLSAGMAVTAEIKTGSRRIIDYLLSPLRRYAQESLRER